MQTENSQLGLETWVYFKQKKTHSLAWHRKKVLHVPSEKQGGVMTKKLLKQSDAGEQEPGT